MKKQTRNCQYRLSRCLSHVKLKTVMTVFVVLAIVIAVIPLIAIIPFVGIPLGDFLVDALSPVSLRNITYHGLCKDNSGVASSIAYAFGVLFISGVLIPFVTNYLRTLGDRYSNGILDRYKWSGHTLFLGYDELMIGTLRRMCQEAKVQDKENKKKPTIPKVIVAVPYGVAALRTQLQGLVGDGVEVVQCNQCDPENLCSRACVKSARRLFVVGQPDDPTHDATNLKTLDLLSEIFEKTHTADCYLYVRNRASFSLIQRQGFMEKDTARSLRRRTNFFNIHETIAGKLLSGIDSDAEHMSLDYQNEKKNLAVCPDANVHLVIMGMTEMGMALARETLMVAHYPDHRVKITMVDERARDEMFYFIGRYKDLFKHCRYSFEDLDDKEKKIEPDENVKELLDVEFEFIQSNMAHPLLNEKIESWSNEESEILTLVVCTNDSPQNMATALYLPRVIMDGENAISVWVYQQGDNSMQEFKSHQLYKRLHTFSAEEYGNVCLEGSLTLAWAEEVAKAYEQSSLNSKKSKDWSTMSQYERWSSLYNVRSLIAKLRGIGYDMTMKDGIMRVRCFKDVPATDCNEFKPSYDDILKISCTEHSRWMVEALTKGMRPTTGEEHLKVLEDKKYKDILKKTIFAHDDIRPYDELTPETAAYDVDMTKAMIIAINEKLEIPNKNER